MKRLLFWIFFTIFVIIIGVFIWIYQVIVSLQEPVTAVGDGVFQVSSGETWDAILSRLESEKWINRSTGLEFYVKFRELSPKQGNYKITEEMTASQLISTIHRGILNRPEVTITIPEGSDLQEIAAIVSQGLNFSADEFIRTTDSFDTTQYDFIQGDSLEGYLFPDTYRFFKSSSPEEIIVRMLTNFQRKAVPELRATETLSAYEVLILASIVEKEVFSPEDRRLVAGIFLNRLDVGMMLQSDATVNYVTRSGRAQSTLQDLEIDSPYNTYKVTGLPPSPITSSGLDSIKAVLEPEDSDYLFFLTTLDSPPVTIYSRTFEEHVQAKAKYLK